MSLADSIDAMMANSRAQEMADYARSLGQEVNRLQAEVERLRTQVYEMGSDCAANLAWRYTLMNQLAAVDPYNQFLTEKVLITHVTEGGRKMYSIRSDFDDVRRWAAGYIACHREGEVKARITREDFIKFAKLGMYWRALDQRLDNANPTRYAARRRMRTYAERVPEILLKLTGDVGNNAFHPVEIQDIVDRAGAEWDSLNTSGRLEEDPKLMPVQYAMEFGMKSRAGNWMELDELDLMVRNEKEHYRPPKGLFAAMPGQQNDPPPLID